MRARLHGYAPCSGDNPVTQYFDERVLSGVLVFVVDDDPNALALTRTVLERRGAAVAVAHSASAARAWLREWIPSVIVCDLSMPEEDGIVFIQSLRQTDGPNRSCKAIALSGLDEATSRQPALAAGFDAFVSKAAPTEVLVAVLRIVERGRELTT